MKDQDHLRHLVVIAVEECDGNPQNPSQASRHLIVRSMNTQLVAIDPRRRHKLVQTGLNPKLLLTQAKRTPRLL